MGWSTRPVLRMAASLRLGVRRLGHFRDNTINPAVLVIEIRMALKEIIQELCEGQQFRNGLADVIRKEFSYGLGSGMTVLK